VALLPGQNDLFRKLSQNEGLEIQQIRYLVSPKIDVPKPLVFGTSIALPIAAVVTLKPELDWTRHVGSISRVACEQL
jgi:hypothetical protein